MIKTFCFVIACLTASQLTMAFTETNTSTDIAGGSAVSPETSPQNDIQNGSARIVGGVVSTNPYPWVVSLQTDTKSHFCGGSLINEYWVLTAAHCLDDVDASDLRLYIGGLSSVRTNTTAELRRAELVIAHSLYSEDDDYINDIALIKLSEASTKTPVALGSSQVNDALSFGTDLKVMGWGLTSEDGRTSSEELREVLVGYQTDTTCRNIYSNTQSYWDLFICAGEPEGGKDSCSGDSGGPLLTNVNDEHVQVGIVSWGSGCAREGLYGAYTEIASYHDWIAQAMQSTNIIGPDKIGFLAENDTAVRKKSESYFISNLSQSSVAISSKMVVDSEFGTQPSSNFEVDETNWLFNSIVPAQSLCEFKVNALGSSSGEHDAYIKIETNGETLLKKINAKVLPKDSSVDDTLDNQWVWFNGHDRAWTTITDNTDDYLQSGLIDKSQRSVLLTYLNGPGYLVFDTKISSEENYDALLLLVNEEQDTVISGERDWATLQSQELSNGVNHIMFMYVKDAVFNGGQDRAWLNDIRLCQQPGVENTCTRALSDYSATTTLPSLNAADVCQSLSAESTSLTFRSGPVSSFFPLDNSGAGNPDPSGQGSDDDTGPFGVGSLFSLLLILPILLRAKQRQSST